MNFDMLIKKTCIARKIKAKRNFPNITKMNLKHEIKTRLLIRFIYCFEVTFAVTPQPKTSSDITNLILELKMREF